MSIWRKPAMRACEKVEGSDAARLRPARADQRQRLRRRADRHRQRHRPLHARAGLRAGSATLGIVNVPGLDASDRDNAINIRSGRCSACTSRMRSPSFEFGIDDVPDHGERRRRARLARACRRGARRLADAGCDGVSRTPRRSKANGNLGRLNVTKTLGDTDGDGDFDPLYTLGGRSFSIWTDRRHAGVRQRQRLRAHHRGARPGVLQREQRRPHLRQPLRQQGTGAGSGWRSARSASARTRSSASSAWAASWSTTSPTRSRRCSSTTSTIATSRSIPRRAEAAKDLGPEGVIFIDAKDSPTRSPLLVVANEVSGTVTLYSVTEKSETGAGRGFAVKLSSAALCCTAEFHPFSLPAPL